MKKWALLLTVAIIAMLPCSLQAQVNGYFPDLWKEKPTPHAITSTGYPYTVLDYRIVRDFNVNRADKANNYTHYKTIYKSVLVNTQAAADSLTQLIMTIESNEELRGLRIRTISPDGQTKDLNNQVRMLPLNDARKALVVNNLVLQPGAEIAYELSLKVAWDYAGTEILQSSLSSDHVSFLLVAPKELEFRFKTSPGVPAITDSTGGISRYYRLNMQPVPALKGDDRYYFLPQLQRVDFALKQVVDGKDTTRMTWQQFGDDNYIPFVAISKAEFKQLEKELPKWNFTQQRMPTPQMIYMVEQFIKTNFTLTAPTETGETIDIISILKSRRAEKTGMIRLMNAVYYMLNIPTQMLFTSARDSILPDSQMVNRQLPRNVLLYFPQVQQALSPTDMNTRFPCYPSLWAGIPALRCRDTLIGQESKVLTDFVTTPIVPYTLSNITLDATLKSITEPTWEVKQAFGGYPAANIKHAFGMANNDTEAKFRLYNALLPFEPGVRKPTAVTTENELFNNRMLDKPMRLNSTLNTPSLIENKNTQVIIHLGQLLGGTIATDADMPPGNLPVQIAFPYYQEKRVNIPIPEGYKILNKGDFSADINDSGNQPALGYKMRCEQEGNMLHIFIVEWYKQMDLNGTQKNLFGQIQQQISKTQHLDLVLQKD
ncbi:MAG: DUF3857 domain-containing protein [Chitinophaga sp.]|uniref:DUF3857 domain-containing protein n=1 Tax=Chitinophaga sp. TaxID=1869181 RepID=UPI001B040A5E|nr:DUF3857 domain-containing protein [Chitinophaga sp.]MBO9733235.1 DUF3857 domain-containing protein [Chitinophaga sp.]